jgi:hypothetical protein
MKDNRMIHGTGLQQPRAPHTPNLCHSWQEYPTTYRQCSDFSAGAGVYPILITISLTRTAT